MEGLGLEDSNEIQYSEFLAATMDMNHAIREENILRAFQHFDTDGSGEFTRLAEYPSCSHSPFIM